MGTTETLPIDVASPAAARRFVRGLLGDHDCIDSAELVVSELVTNVIRHARHVRAIEVTVRSHADTVRIEVTQEAGLDRPGDGVIAEEPVWPQAHQLAGRGLRIVDALSEIWGVSEVDGTTVWSVIACSSDAHRSSQ